MMMMMSVLLANRRFCSMARSPLSSRFFSASAPESTNFIFSDYLIFSFGFSPDKAVKLSKRFAHFKSPEQPDSVRRFLQDQGFSQSDVQNLVTTNPNILRCSPEKTLDPNLRAIRNMGLSISAVNRIILSAPQALMLKSAAPRIKFWLDFFDQDEAALAEACKRNLGLVAHDIGRLVIPRISLLRSQGFSTQDIQVIVRKVDRLIICKISGMEDLLKRTKELGFQSGSGMFLQGLHAMVCVTRDALHKKMEFFMSFGWSEEDFVFAVRKAPRMVTHKEENLRAKMDFLLGEARCVPSYIASYPQLLGYSLEKRLRPRGHVLHLLETKGLCQERSVLYNDICRSNSDFAEKYILPYKGIFPELHKEFLRACASGSG